MNIWILISSQILCTLNLKSSIVRRQLLSYCFGQVAAVVFTENMKRLYVTMKEGFPLEYVVSYLIIDTADQKYQIYKVLLLLGASDWLTWFLSVGWYPSRSLSFWDYYKFWSGSRSPSEATDPLFFESCDCIFTWNTNSMAYKGVSDPSTHHFQSIYLQEV